MNGLAELPNIGRVLAEKLTEVGIRNPEDLAAVGSIGAVFKVRGNDGSGCYNMLYALEGAIRGCRWHAIPKEERAALRREFDGMLYSLQRNDLGDRT